MSSTKRKAPPVRIAQPQTTRNAKPMAKARINESKTSVVTVPKHQQKSKKKAAGEAIEISSDESDNDNAAALDEDDLMDEDEPAEAEADEPKTNGHANGMKKDNAAATTNNNDDDDDNASANEDEEDHEPTFGDLVREHETVDVTAALIQLNPTEANSTDAATNGAVSGKNATSAPTLASLGHLLNAALRSGDDANLEVCFNTTTDAVWVRNTIQRLDPSLAGTLLQKLAARIHRRPGRAHTLVGWVQWTLITHGGALLANQAGVTRALQELHRVLEERARGLNSLLLLKGKLDMLEAQMQLRRLQRSGGNGNSNNNGHSGVATVGGRAGSSKALDSVSSLSRRGAGGRRRNGGGLSVRGARGDVDDDEDFVAMYREEDDVEEDVTGQILVNGAGVAGESFIVDSDEEALDEDDDEDSEGDEDDDAEDDDDVEEMDEDDAVEEDEVDFDDVDDEDDDDDEDDEEDAAAAPPPKLQKKSGGAFSKRR